MKIGRSYFNDDALTDMTKKSFQDLCVKNQVGVDKDVAWDAVQAAKKIAKKGRLTLTEAHAENVESGKIEELIPVS